MTTVEEKAVLDRIEDQQHAVLLVGEQERERIVPVSALPADAKPGQWLRIRIRGDKVTEIMIDSEQTQRVEQRVADKLARLRQRGR